jgi:hypothetical protein
LTKLDDGDFNMKMLGFKDELQSGYQVKSAALIMRVDEETNLQDTDLPEHQLFALFFLNAKLKEEFIQVRSLSNPEEVLFT